LQDTWKQSDFKSSEEELVKLIPEVLNSLPKEELTPTNKRRRKS
jgi:hypothetical protein